MQQGKLSANSNARLDQVMNSVDLGSSGKKVHAEIYVCITCEYN